MEYQIGALFRENEDTETPGFIIININEHTYEVAERWVSDLMDDNPIVAYSIPKDELHERVERGAATFLKNVPERVESFRRKVGR